MFTGLIEEIAKVEKIDFIAGGRRIKIGADKILDDLKIDDSVAVNGVCLTAVEVDNSGFWAEAVGETLTKSTITELRQNSMVNLERAVRLNDRLGGHLVQGHVNGIGTITRIVKLGENYFVEINLPDELKKYVIAEGSVAIDGISLTIAQINDIKIGLSIIPHTWNNTNLRIKKVGDSVNIEVDVIAKYVEKLLGSKSDNDNKYTDEWFKNLGY